MNKYLESHDFPDDLRKMDYDDLELLTYEIRDFLVEEVSKSGRTSFVKSGSRGAFHSSPQSI